MFSWMLLKGFFRLSLSLQDLNKVNYSKPMLGPINMEEHRAAALAQAFGCVIGSLPFTFLGLPLGLSKPKVIDCSHWSQNVKKGSLAPLHFCLKQVVWK